MSRHFKIRSYSGLLMAFALLLVAVSPLPAQISSSNPSQILQQYRGFRTNWMTTIWPYANTLFGLLATIEFAWSAAVMALEKTDLQSWTSALLRKVMWLGAFYALLMFGRQWIPAIIDSFSQLGGSAAGIDGNQGLSPSGVFTQGLNIAAALMDGASSSAFFTNPASSLAVMVAAAFVVLAFTAITIQYVVAVVESYLVVAAGVIFLGFGGSRWTTPYVERYIGLGVSTGIKIMLLYMLIGVGMSLAGGWLDEAIGVGTSPNPSMTAFDVMGAALIFMMLCWQIPKLFAAVLGGSPALSGGDLLATATGVAAGAAMVGSLAGGSARAVGGGVAAVSRALSAGEGSSGAGPAAVSSLSAVNGSRTDTGGVNGTPRQPSPPINSSGTGSGGGRRDVQPPADAALAAVGGERLAGSGFESERPARGYTSTSTPLGGTESTGTDSAIGSSDRPSTEFTDSGLGTPRRDSNGWNGGGSSGLHRRRFSIIPSDAATHAQPPRMPIDHEE